MAPFLERSNSIDEVRRRWDFRDGISGIRFLAMGFSPMAFFLEPIDGSFALGGDGGTRRMKWAGGVAVGYVWTLGFYYGGVEEGKSVIE